jgi:hypothetical protein
LKMRDRRWLLAIPLLLLPLAWLLLPIRHAQEKEISPPAQSPIATPAIAAAKAPVLAASALAEARLCAPGDYESIPELAAFLLSRPGVAKTGRLESRIVQFRDSGGGRPFRATLDFSPGESGRGTYKLKLFSVDNEGLPDPQPLPADLPSNPEGMNQLLAGKLVERELEARAYPVEGGREWRVETENGEVKELEAFPGDHHLICSSAFGSPSCHCAKNIVK